MNVALYPQSSLGENEPQATMTERVIFEPFIPTHLKNRLELLPRVRMFLISHLLGPVIGLALAAYLFILEHRLDFPVATIALSVAAFWIYPIALRVTGRFTELAFLSLQHLTFVILFASHYYGGVQSPFFFWLLVVPLFGYFYLGDIPRLRMAVVIALITGLLVYFGVTPLLAPARPTVAAGDDTLMLVSVFGAGIYILTMALSHAHLLGRQIALQRQSEAQRLISEELLFAKEAAEAANRAKSAFLATTSHELRTPLNAIIGFSRFIQTQPHGSVDDKYQTYLKDIEENGNHLLEIINDLLDVAKSEAGRLHLAEEEIDVRNSVAASLRLVHRRAAQAGVSVSVDVPAELPHLWADRRRLKQMLLNLLGNAIKFTPKGGSISVSARASGSGIEIAVTDTGIGIAPDDLPNVVKPFYQVDGSLSRRHEGMGLGLPLVCNIMARHAGALKLASELGKGTAATLCFPVARTRKVGVSSLNETTA